MIRVSKLVTISVPPALLTKARMVAKKEGRTQAELFREALRFYLTARPFPVPDLRRPTRTPKSEGWFWTKEWQGAMKEATEDVLAGRLHGPFASVREMKKAIKRS